MSVPDPRLLSRPFSPDAIERAKHLADGRRHVVEAHEEGVDRLGRDVHRSPRVELGAAAPTVVVALLVGSPMAIATLTAFAFSAGGGGFL